MKILGDLQVSRNLAALSLSLQPNEYTVSPSTITLDKSYSSVLIFSGIDAGQIVSLGDATDYLEGQAYFIQNLSTQSINIQDGDGNTLVKLLPYQRATWFLQDNTSTEGIWIYTIEDQLLQDTTATVNNTVTTGQTISVPLDTGIFIETKILAVRTGGLVGSVGDNAAFIRQFRAKNISNVVSLGRVQSSFTDGDQPAWLVGFTPSGSNILVQVTGANYNNVSWYISTRIQVLGF